MLASIARALDVAPQDTAAGTVEELIDLQGGSTDNWLVQVLHGADDGNACTVLARRQGALQGGGEEQYMTSISMVEGIPMPGFCDHKRWQSLRTKLKGALCPEDIVVSTCDYSSQYECIALCALCGYASFISQFLSARPCVRHLLPGAGTRSVERPGRSRLRCCS